MFENDAGKKRREQKLYEAELGELYTQTGRLTTQNEWLKKIWPLSCVLPSAICRRICAWLNYYENIHINHKAVYRHMREMCIQAVYPSQDISRPEPANSIYPYLLNGLHINHPDHVWSIDITYVPIQSLWLYLAAIIYWYSRYVLDGQMMIPWTLVCTVSQPEYPENIGFGDYEQWSGKSFYKSQIYRNFLWGLEAGQRGPQWACQ